MLTDAQRRRYVRNIGLAGIGESGQEKLLAARVLVVGAGGLGSASLSYLAAAGVGHIGIADYDRVELSNLQRQIVHETGDIGRLKAESARDRIQELNPDVGVTLHTEKLNESNAEAVIARYDVVADGCDNFATRFAVNAACHRVEKPLVSAAIRAWEGQLTVFKSYLGAPHPCYRCFVAANPDDERGCNDAGIMGAFAGVMGSLQALEVIKELTHSPNRHSGTGENPSQAPCDAKLSAATDSRPTLIEAGGDENALNSLTDKLLLFDGLTLRSRIVRLNRDPQCACCGAER